MSEKCQVGMVLIIEDEPELLSFASRVLGLEGYHVIQAKNSDEGLKLVKRRQVTLVLLDLRLPGGDGWLVLEKLNNDSKLSRVPVIIFTASADALQREKALSMGAADYLVKPVSAGTLRKAVSCALSLKRRC